MSRRPRYACSRLTNQHRQRARRSASHRPLRARVEQLEDRRVLAVAVGFEGPFELQNWTDTGISGGTTTITPTSGASSIAEFAYNVNLGANGVSLRTADFTLSGGSPATGIVRFDYDYSGFHAFFGADADFLTLNGSQTTTVVDSNTSGAFDFSGSRSLVVTEGDQFGFRIGGSNLDSDSRLIGTLTISNFTASEGFVVDSLADTGDDGDYSPGNVTLREAIELANAIPGADTISFDPSVFGTAQTISLGGQLPAITEALTIAGPGADLLTIDAGGGADNTVGNGDGFRLFEVDDFQASTIDVSISGVRLTGGDPADAGGAIKSTENLSLADSVITGNATGARGGGVASYGASLSISTSTISSNQVNATFADGGGVFAQDGALSVANTTISGNMAGAGGGVFAGGDVVASLVQSTVSSNLASFRGGGLFAVGIAAVTISQSTIAANNATDGAGGVFRTGAATVAFDNSIVALNTSPGFGPDLAADFQAFTADYSLIGDTTDSSITPTTGTGNVLDVNPLLGPLANNGGPTSTHALLPGSPAIDAGDPAFSSPPDYDQRGSGFARVNGSRVDIGAYEADLVAPTLLGASLTSSSGTSFAKAGDTITLSFTASEPILVGEVTFRGSQATSVVNTGGNDWIATLDVTASIPTEGIVDSSTIAVTYQDLAGNAGGAPTISGVVTVDVTAPTIVGAEVSSSSGTAFATTGDTLRLTLPASEPIDIVGVTFAGFAATFIGDTGNNIWSAGLSVSGSAPSDGVISDAQIVVTYVDLAGNFGVDPMFASSITVDRVAPIVGVDPLLTTDATPDLTGSVDDPLATVMVSVAGQGPLLAVTNRDGTWRLPGTLFSGPIANGVYDVSVAATDGAGNVGTDSTTEELTVLTSPLAVDNPSDESDGDYSLGDLSLREAIELANTFSGADTITFDPVVFAAPQTINIGSQLPTITDGLTIAGPGADLLTIDAGSTTTPFARDGFRIFEVSDGTATLIDVSISGVTLTGADLPSLPVASSVGGAINNFENLTLDAVWLVANGARFGGALSNSSGAVLTITNSTLSGNVASQNGGGVNNGGTMVISNSTIAGNTANGLGGAIITNTNSGQPLATLEIANSTISGNSGFSGIYLFTDLGEPTSVDLQNTIVGDSVSPASGLATLTGDNNLFELLDPGIVGANNQFFTAPLLAPLQDNGGPTPTLALLPGSPAIDAGDPAFASPPDFDQRGAGFSRVSNGRIDLGAYELQATTLNAGDFNADGRVDNTDLNLLLANWGATTVPPEWVNGFDTQVDNDELNALLSGWGSGLSTSFATAQSDADVTDESQVETSDEAFALIAEETPEAEFRFARATAAAPTTADDSLLLLASVEDPSSDASSAIDAEVTTEEETPKRSRNGGRLRSVISSWRSV